MKNTYYVTTHNNKPVLRSIEPNIMHYPIHGGPYSTKYRGSLFADFLGKVLYFLDYNDAHDFCTTFNSIWQSYDCN